MVIESEPGTRLADLGLDYADLRKVREDLIHISMTPYGRGSASADASVTDLTLLAGGGPAWSCGYDDHTLPPVRGGGNQGYHTGCHIAVISSSTPILLRLSCPSSAAPISRKMASGNCASSPSSRTHSSIRPNSCG